MNVFGREEEEVCIRPCYRDEKTKNVTHPTACDHRDSYTYREMVETEILRFGQHLGTAHRLFPEVVQGPIFSTYRTPISLLSVLLNTLMFFGSILSYC